MRMFLTGPRPGSQYSNLGKTNGTMIFWVIAYLWPALLHAGPVLANGWIAVLTVLIVAVHRVNHRPVRPRCDLREAANASGRYPPTPAAAGTPRRQS